MAVKGPDGRTEFEKNAEGVTNLLAQVPANPHVTVIGITDRSFAQPYILLSASVSDQPGYFGERLKAARRGLVRAWMVRSASLQPSLHETDILGALQLAGEIFDESALYPDKKVLVIFSDMRNSTPELNLESQRGRQLAIRANKEGSAFQVHLAQVSVYALGVDGAGKTYAEWQTIEKFWDRIFARFGASMRGFSPQRAAALDVQVAR